MYDVLCSFGLTCVILILMFLITWKGTLAQVEIGLFEAQKKYFDSAFFTEDLLGVPIPVPGGYLLMGALFLNLLLGGMVRIRKRRATAGIIVVHIGIALMLLAGFVKMHHSTEGAIRFCKGQEASEFVSHHEWQLAIAARQDDDTWREYVIEGPRFLSLSASERATFTHDELPFRVELHGFARNGYVRPDGVGDRTSQPVIDGFWVDRLALNPENEKNLAASYVDLIPGDGAGESVTGILWGVGRDPFAAEVGGRQYTINLRKKIFPLDFSFRLDKFHKKDHPGTTMAADFRSWVTKFEGESRENTQKIEISMNEPLRHRGYVVYQNQFGPPDDESDGEFYSILAVVENPSDQWPLYSCIIISIGLLMHFIRKLSLYAKAENRAAETAETPEPSEVPT